MVLGFRRSEQDEGVDDENTQQSRALSGLARARRRVNDVRFFIISKKYISECVERHSYTIKPREIDILLQNLLKTIFWNQLIY